MENLPEAKSASTPSLPERGEHREWIGGRAITLLSHYWRDDDPTELTAAIGQDWADVLEDIPQEYIQRACLRYQRENPRRKPTPGAIYELARAAMPDPRIARLPPVAPMSKEDEEAYRASVARDKINPERKAQAEAIMARFKTGNRE